MVVETCIHRCICVLFPPVGHALTRAVDELILVVSVVAVYRVTAACNVTELPGLRVPRRSVCSSTAPGTRSGFLVEVRGTCVVLTGHPRYENRLASCWLT